MRKCFCSYGGTNDQARRVAAGRIEGNKLFFTYQHQTLNDDFKTGKCESIITFDGAKLSLNENWEWTCNDYSKGTSILIEL